MKKATRDWVRKAEADFRGALETRQRPRAVVGFHCQQSVEKYLKALREELGQHIPKTHALDDLLSLLLPYHATLASVRRGIFFLTDFAVDPRYPGTGTSKREAASALRWAGRVRDAAGRSSAYGRRAVAASESDRTDRGRRVIELARRPRVRSIVVQDRAQAAFLVNSELPLAPNRSR